MLLEIILGCIVVLALLILFITIGNNKFSFAIIRIEEAENNIEVLLHKKYDLLQRCCPIIIKELKVKDFLPDIGEIKLEEINDELNNIKKDLPFQIIFDTRDAIQQCMDIFNNATINFTPDNNSYSGFILEVMLPIITQLAYTGIQNTSPELITKIISGQYNNIIQQRIAQLLNDALQNNRTLPELTLNNLLDENLVKVYDIKSLIDSEDYKNEKHNYILRNQTIPVFSVLFTAVI